MTDVHLWLFEDFDGHRVVSVDAEQLSFMRVPLRKLAAIDRHLPACPRFGTLCLEFALDLCLPYISSGLESSV